MEKIKIVVTDKVGAVFDVRVFTPEYTKAGNFTAPTQQHFDEVLALSDKGYLVSFKRYQGDAKSWKGKRWVFSDGRTSRA